MGEYSGRGVWNLLAGEIFGFWVIPDLTLLISSTA